MPGTLSTDAGTGPARVGSCGEERIAVASAGYDPAPPTVGYRTLARLAAVVLVVVAVATAGLTLGLERPPSWGVSALTVVAVAVVALGLAAALARSVPGAAFAVLIVAASACVLVTIGRTGPVHPTWAWLVFPVLLVGTSPQRRWTTPFCVVLTGLFLLVVAALPTPAAGMYVDLLRSATFGAILLGLGDLQRRSVDAFQIEVARTETLHRAVARAASASMSFVASVGRYVAGPLRSIEAASETLGGAGAGEARVQACRRIILAADEVDAVVDDVLDRERMQAGLFMLERAPVDLADVVIRAAAAAGHAITVDGDRFLVFADEDRLSYALTTLMEAAADSSGSDGLHAILTPEGRGVRLRVPAARVRRSGDPRSPAGEGLAAAVVEAHGGELRTEPDLALWLPVAEPASDSTQPDAEAVLRARDDQARWLVVLVLALVAVGLVLGPAWAGNLALFLTAQIALVVVERLTQPDVVHRDVRTAARVVVNAVFGVLVAASGGLLSPLWAVSGLLVVGDRDQSRRTTLGLGVVGSCAVGIALLVTWPAGLPLIYGAPPMAVPLLTAVLVARANDAIDTHRRELEALGHELEESRAATSMFLAVISHELRTPLTSVRGYAESLLLPRPWTEDNVSEFVTAIGEESGTLRRLVAELDDTSMIQRGTLAVDAAPMDVEDAVRGAVRRQQVRSPGRSVHLVCQARLPPAVADARRVGQVLANLLDNAVKHAPSSPIDVAVHADGKSVYVEVADHGPGIPPELRRGVFEPFRRTLDRRSPGVGLGLYVCKGIVDAHGPGARIRCDETPGGGTTFEVALPRADVADVRDRTMAVRDEQGPRQWRT